jgi:hypothetical protein
MEPFRRQPHLQDSHIIRQDSIQSPLQVAQVVPPPRIKANDLPSGMNPSIGPASTHHLRLSPGHILQGSLDLSLNSPPMGLDLKAVKVCTIVFDFGPKPAQFNRV